MVHSSVPNKPAPKAKRATEQALEYNDETIQSKATGVPRAIARSLTLLDNHCQQSLPRQSFFDDLGRNNSLEHLGGLLTKSSAGRTAFAIIIIIAMIVQVAW